MKQLTKSTRARDIVRTWHLVDVKDKVLGRVSTEIAQKLMGKYKPSFVRHLDCGDHVVVINARHVAVTGKKEKEKLYSHYSGFPGGLKQKPLWKLRIEKPKEIVRSAVFGMLPKNALRDRLITRLYIYPDEDHPYKNRFL
ncbi:50S ribosomal protein L13 [Candidatus Gottesmanbacteria bacterium RIFCSPLOWO2_01_FULL_49_10]|uniref:Large ribosomal subunit protein uL13 n=1 Tax=Candidatus Gottesmanbacteria bacterium RIFCSPLOWO2_01_FULL_49_10 TaxID=1798396 RepID=A0A1F6AXI8_9BACT|nr:MAG: Large subunit ribosomal protein L13 [Microgenomates group bacterium GW2011_GWA2_47_8]OGG29405.1 MAG: 50S ribosomal protein L13 [Candidatus Gottesmanbacteria bacterium RIFCSPLOWO2_01_FULL_49_10]